MTKNIGFLRVVSLVLVVMTMFCLSTSAFAAGDLSDYIDEGKQLTYESYVISKISNKDLNKYIHIVKLEDIDPSSSETQLWKDSSYAYFLKSEYTVDELKQEALQLYKSENTVTKINEIQNDIGIGADIEAGTESISGLIPIVNWLLGIATVGITLLLAIVTALDIVYIAFPVFQERANDAASQNPNWGKPDPKNGGTRPIFVSSEAMYAVKAAAADMNGKNPLTIYFGKRVFAYIMVSVVLFILLTGNINIITNLALNVVSSIMNIIANLGK